MGRNVPASLRVLKNSIEKINITPVAATEPMPLEPVMNPPICLMFATTSITPGAFSTSVTRNHDEIMPVIMGTEINATVGVVFLVMMRNSMTITVAKPRNANIKILPVFYSFLDYSLPGAAGKSRFPAA
ncbi:hypothetical protein SDC9_189884 [bioreactor metagenome]|uniref:Uncharacterized protein n=1 Tax=bioreactor metagenome TaxID=1076179 RepID=A0A645HTN3_9ZZZZ